MFPPRPSDSRRTVPVLLALLCLVVLLEGLRGASRPYWSDELASVHVAGASSWGEMLHLSRTVDLNPPLFYVLERLSFRVFGQEEFAGRLPSVLSFAVAVGCIFLFLRRRVPLAFAVFGALLPLCNEEVSYYAAEARPYALLLGALSAAVLAYDSIVLGVRPGLARAALFVAASALLLAHMFGSLAFAALLLAEAVRTWRTRRVDGLTWAALLLPLACCITYLPFLGQAGGGGHPGGDQGLVYRLRDRVSLARCAGVYRNFLVLPLASLLELVALVLLLYPGFPARRLSFARLTREAWTALLVLLAMPVLLAALFVLRLPQGGYYPRYSIAVVLPACLLFALFVGWRAEGSRTVGSLLVAAAVLFVAAHSRDLAAFTRTVPSHGLLSAPAGLNSTGGVSELFPDLRVVMSDPILFFAADHRLDPKDRARLVYLTDRREAFRLEQFNAGESIADMARAFHLHSQVVPYRAFTERNPRFLLVGRRGHQEWLLDALDERKARMQWLGEHHYAGEDQSLWLVDLAPR